jgi:hypothetical protein
MNKKYYLVYQVGIANVIERTNWHDGNEAFSRILQSDFRTCEVFCRALRYMGAYVIPAWCNRAGDIIDQPWNYDEFYNAPFHESFAKDFVAEGD